MTTQQLLQRLIRRWKVSSLANVPADSMLQLLDCINGSIQEFYALCPAVYRKGQVSEILAAPVIHSVGVTSGSDTFTGYSAPDSLFGSTIVIGPDKNDNMLMPPGNLRDTYQGTSGTQNATIYGDAISLATNIETMLDEPELVGTLPRLRRMDEYWGRPWNPSLYWSDSINATPYRQVSIPRSYWVEANVPDLNGVPSFVFRVDPMPDKLYRVRFRALFYPQRLGMADMQRNTALTVNEAWIERLLIPLIHERMSDDGLWQGPNVKIVADKAMMARTGIEKLSADVLKPANRVETPKGY